MFASAAEDVRVWSSTSLDLCWKFDVGSPSKLASISWTTDGEQLLSVVRGCDAVQVTEFIGGQLRHTQSHVGVACSCGQLNPCGDGWACLGSCDGTVLLWDVKNRTAIQSYKPHNKTVTCVAFASDGSLVVSTSCDGSVSARALDSKGILSICEPTGKAVTALECSPQNTFRFVFAALDGCIFVWDASAQHPLQKHQLHSPQAVSGLSVSPVCEALVASVGLDGRLVLFDTATAGEQAIVRAPESLESVSFLMDGQRLVVGGTSGQLYLYDLRCARWEPPVTLKHPHATPVTAISTACHVPAKAQTAMSVSLGAAYDAPWTKPPHLDLPVRFSLSAEPDSPDSLTKMSTPNWLPGPVHGEGDSSPVGFHYSFTKGSPMNDSTYSASSPGDVNNSTFSQHSVFTKEQPAEVSSLLDASWRSSYSGSRQPFRLSDIMPVLPGTPLSHRDSQITLPRPLTASPCDESAKAKAINDRLGESPAAVSSGSVSETASPASKQASGGSKECTFRSVLSAEDYSSLRRVVESLVDEWGHRLDAHIRHVHMQLTMMQHSYMMEVQAMNQQLFDEVLALRTDIEQLRLDG